MSIKLKLIVFIFFILQFISVNGQDIINTNPRSDYQYEGNSKEIINQDEPIAQGFSGIRVKQNREIHPLLYDTLIKGYFLPDGNYSCYTQGKLLKDIPAELARYYPNVLFFSAHHGCIVSQGNGYTDLMGYKDGAVFDVIHDFNYLQIDTNKVMTPSFNEKVLFLLGFIHLLEDSIRIDFVEPTQFKPYEKFITFNFKVYARLGNKDISCYLFVNNGQVEYIYSDINRPRYWEIEKVRSDKIIGNTYYKDLLTAE